MFKIRINNLLGQPEGSRQKENLNGQLTVNDQLITVQGGVVLTRLAYAIHAELKDITTQFTCTCQRCLESFVLPLKFTAEGRDYLIHPANEIERKDNFAVDWKYQTIDLSEYLTQEVELALPFYPLCQEQCRGLCPNCGANLNYHPCSCQTTVELSDGDEEVLYHPFAELKDLASDFQKKKKSKKA